ncbi:YhcN/YlaJ family sporulation lipoprotein [Paenibacillus harenae]|uniref:YhcN/YlaJ family sporulation lipoprotein n=1 Tax=Paenibacillus harenae TaxID=306543 RepID=UPI00279419B0|nr:YhcN/YlaJ family sporulation lipoprotein [Paenibacillus harenae]MDQ0064040.1 YhcN/YlaJ family sporulation lipoprotein [Paenibacillus harenae]
MYNNMTAVKRLVLLMMSLMLFATGCALTDNGQVRQQNTRNDRQEILRDRGNADNQINRPFGNADNREVTEDRNNQNNTNAIGARNNGNNGLDTAEERVEVADRAAENITKLKGIRQANVLVTQRNAYVAAVLDDEQQKLTQDIEDQIANQVRTENSNIRDVFVSTNPQFVDRINQYVDDVQQGRPVAGFVEQFNEMVARIFPNAR